jgi:hypothetical protein
LKSPPDPLEYSDSVRIAPGPRRPAASGEPNAEGRHRSCCWLLMFGYCKDRFTGCLFSIESLTGSKAWRNGRCVRVW